MNIYVIEYISELHFSNIFPFKNLFMFGNRRPLAVKGPCAPYTLHIPSYGPDYTSRIPKIYTKLKMKL